MALFREAIENRMWVDVVFDDRTTLRIRKKDWQKFRLSENEEIEIQEYEKEIFRAQINEGYEAALSILDYAAKTENEIRKKLLMKGYLESVSDYVVERLASVRLLDDRAIAERIAEGAANRGIGAYALKRKLKMRGLSEDDTEYACALMDDEQEKEGCKREAARLYKKYASLESREARKRLTQALARRGYSWDAVTSAVNEILEEDFDD